MSEATSTSEPGGPSRFGIAGLTLDLQREELRSPTGERIELRPRSFAVLRHLARNAARVVTKDELLAAIWTGVIVTEDSLTQCISEIRRALGEEGRKALRTVTRRGYMLVLDDPPAVARTVTTKVEPLPDLDKPSLAVMPFQNMSGDQDQEYFADGIAEDIITMLLRSRSLFVLARNSSFMYKGRVVDAKQIGREQNVRYVLEGSVRRSGNRVRITAQLIDTETGRHVWAERYDREPADVFAVQDEITEAVTIAIEPAVSDMERRRVLRKPPESLSAWEAYQRGLWHWSRISLIDNEAARRFFQQAIDLDPHFAAAHARLAHAIFDAASIYQASSIAEAVQNGLPLAQRAVALDPLDPIGLCSRGWGFYGQGDHEGATAEARQALSICRNYAAAHGLLGAALVFSGHHHEAIDALRQAIRLDPHDPLRYLRLNHIVTAQYFLGKYEDAAAGAKELLRSYPDNPFSHRWLAAALGQIGRLEEANRALQAAIASAPKMFDVYVLGRTPWWRLDDHEHMLQGLRKAGWGMRGP
jgi:adenylate cyclase